MKKIMTVLVLSLLFVSGVSYAAMTNTVDSGNNGYWWGGHPIKDIGTLFLQEVETIIEGAGLSATGLALNDSSTLTFGTDLDFTVYSDTASTLEFDPLAAGNTIKFGTAATDAVDIIWYSDTSGDTVTFDEEGVQVQFEDVQLQIMDDTTLSFGDADDVTLQYDEDGNDNLQITGDVAISGTSTLTGAVTATAGVQSASVAVTAALEASQATIPAGAAFVTITSDDATKVVILPTAVVGNVIRITVTATGAELQTAAAGSDTINAVDCSGGNEMAMAAASVYTLTCQAANTWIATGVGADGAAQATIVPDADS
jgi:hypothetical protein